MVSDDYEQHPITLFLTDIQVCGLPPKTFGGYPDTFITVSVDGDQQLQTKLVHHSLDPKWHFSQPFRLSVYPSSSIGFTIYRKRGTDILGDKHLAVFDAPLFTYIQEGTSGLLSEFPIEIKHGLSTETCKLKVCLEVDTSGIEIGRDSLFNNAAETLENAIGSHGKSSRPSSAGPGVKTAGTVLGTALDSLDQLVKVVDGIAEIHPWCKMAWTLLSAVYKAIKNQRERDGKVKELSHALQDALARARECRNLKAIEGATDVVKALARLVVEGAVLIDEYMKHSTAGNVARSATGLLHKLDTRLEECRKKLGDLKTDLLLDLAIRNLQNGENASLAGKPPREPECRDAESISSSTWNPSVAAPPSGCWNMPALPKHGGVDPSPASRGRQQEPHHPTAFPSPILYPEVTTLSTSPDALHRTIDLATPDYHITPSPPLPRKAPRHQSPSPTQRPAAHAQPRRRWHSKFEAQQLKEMFSSFSDDIIEEILIAKGSQAAAIEALLQMVDSSDHAPGSESILGIGLTLPPLEMPDLSRSNSCNDDESAVTTPDSEISEHPAIIDSPPEGFCDGYVGGFTVANTQPLNILPKRRNTPEPGWIPHQPIGYPRHL